MGRSTTFRLAFTRIARILVGGLACLLLHACDSAEPAAPTASSLALFDLEAVAVQPEASGPAADVFFGDTDLWVYSHPLPENFWVADPWNEGFDRAHLPVACSAGPLAQPISRRVLRKNWTTLQRTDSLPVGNELVIEGDYIRKRSGTKTFPRTLLDYPTVPGAVAAHLGLVSPANPRAYSELTLGIDCRRATVATAPTELVYQVELPENARLDFAVAVRRKEWRAFKDGIRLHGPRAEHVLTFRVLLEQEDGTRTPLWERSVASDERDRYINAKVDLAPWSTEVVRLHFECEFEASGTADEWGALGVWAEPVIWSDVSDARPNIVVLLIDTLRADRLGVYGWARARTPQLDALAKRGVRFQDATSAASWTLPSHASMFTSTYPSQHGLWQDQRLPESLVTVAEVLRDEGYRTAAFAERGFLKADHGFARGFERFNSHVRNCTETFSVAAKWIGERRTPFFAFVHTYKVHAPHVPSDEFSAGYVREYSGEGTGVSFMRELVEDRKGPLPSLDAQRYLSDLYDAEIAELDFAVGEFLAELEEAGKLENTLLVVTSDHGEEFFEHGAFSHGASLYQEQLHVPLIVYWKGHMDGGVVATHLVHGVDLAPTLAAAAGAEAPASWMGKPLSVEPSEGREVFVPMRLRWADPERIGAAAIAIRKGHLKYVSYPAGERVHDAHQGPVLFDLRSDPGETSNLLDEQSARVWSERAEALLERFPQLGETSSFDLDEEALRELEELGYAGADE